MSKRSHVLFVGGLFAAPLLFGATFNPYIRVDQFGYPVKAAKVAVLADPVEGFNAAESYVPGETIEVRRTSDNTIVFSATPASWNRGAVHSQSGDRAWWFDFSSVQAPGEYYLYDPNQDLASDVFQISDTVYLEVLAQATRMFYYQRSGFAKEAAYAGAGWTDAAAFLGTHQDVSCRARWDPGNEDLLRDLQGGWFDAGDFNKYTLWGARVVVDLLLAYDTYPHVFLDNTGIPESGNNVPDLLDEVKWELEWLLRMQEASGAVLGKVAVTGFQSASPPSTVSADRYYGPVSTEATAGSAMAFALGARLYAEQGLHEFAATLRTAALAAWDWAQENPNLPFDNSGFASTDPGTSDYGRLMLRLSAAVALFDLTGETRFRDFFDSHYDQSHAVQWWFFYPFEAELQNMLVHYCTLEDATPSVVKTIKARMLNSIDHAEYMQAIDSQLDAYRAFLKDANYTWGSNSSKAKNGTIYLNMNLLGLDPERRESFRTAAGGYLHYLHGVNAFGKVMLSNMYAFGAINSVDEMYHNWFSYGTIWDHAFLSEVGPPPGYLVGGVNRSYGGTRPGIIDQPIQKRYQDFNDDWPQNSWEITEPAIYYQSAYIRLLAAFIEADGYTIWQATTEWKNLPPADRAPEADPDGDKWSNFWEYAFGEDPLQAGGSQFPQLHLNGDSVDLKIWAQRGELEYGFERSDNLTDWQELDQAPTAGEARWRRWILETPSNFFVRPRADDSNAQ